MHIKHCIISVNSQKQDYEISPAVPFVHSLYQTTPVTLSEN